MSSARRSDPQRSAPQDKKNVVLPCRRTTFLSLRVSSWGGVSIGQTGRRRPGAARGVLLRNAGPERQARQRAAGGGNERRTLGKRNERQATERRVVRVSGSQGLRVVRVIRVRKNRRTRSHLPENDRRSNPIRPDTARTDHTGRCTLLPGNRLHVREPENLKTGKP